MMRRGFRRPVLQLAALLDMLLIVLFAQFLEIKTQVAAEQEQSQSRQASAASQQKELEAERNALREEVDRLKRSEGDVSKENERLRARDAELQDGLRLAREQRDLIGHLAAQLFKLPPEAVEKLLRPAGAAAEKTLSAEEIQQLTRRFQELAANRGNETARHLLTYSELLKRADIWDVYLTDQGNAFITGGGKEASRPIAVTTADAFALALFTHYKSIPQPKGVVIILFSYGNAPFRFREPVLAGIRQATERMQQDSSGRTRFEYGVLGYQPR
jgi:hypothetical protein